MMDNALRAKGRKVCFRLLARSSGFLFLLICFLTSKSQHLLTISKKGHALKEFYLNLRIEELWLSGHHINWETGEPDQNSSDQDIHTHCSAFVAAACKRLNIYLLCPPAHSMQLLANAQYDWLLSSDALIAGWQEIESANSYEKAQQYANDGSVVIATVKSSNPRLPGHIALVRPAEISEDKLTESGPMLIMAGTHNFNYISLKSGFKSHIDEWPEKNILFFFNTKW